MDKDFEIPQHIDEPPQLLLWSADEFVPFACMVLVGIVAGQLIIWTLAGYFLSKSLKRYKDAKPDGYLLHILYWVGLVPTKARSIPNPFIRRWHP